MGMDLKTKVMNVIAPPTVLGILCVLLPPLYLYKFISSCVSFLFPDKVNGKVVLITGASSGIGEHMAYQYAKKGARLVLVARRENNLKQVAENAKKLGAPDVIFVPADVSNPDDCRQFIEKAVHHFGRLDHLVTSAGIANFCLFEEADHVKDFRQIMDVNFWGSVYPTYYAVPHLKKSKGRIVVTASASSFNPLPRMSFYNGSKAAVLAFYETLRIEFGKEIEITIANPGWIDSELSKGKMVYEKGELEVDQDGRDAAVSIMPVEGTEECAKAIVTSACRRRRDVTVPMWYNMLYVFRLFAPEVQDWLYRKLYVTRPGTPKKEIPSKKVLDMVGMKDKMSPSTVQTSDIKID